MRLDTRAIPLAAPPPIVRLNRRGRMGLGELIAELCLSRGDTCKGTFSVAVKGVVEGR